LYKGKPEEVVLQTGVFSRKGTERVIRHAFEIANKENKTVTSISKANALNYSMVFWDEVFEEVSKDYPNITTYSYLVDAAAMHMIMDPARFEVVVTSNLFGDILTDVGAALAGGMGLAAGANLNPEKKYPSMFEPVHGSAPDIAGKGVANPLAAIWSVSQMFDFFGYANRGKEILQAIEQIMVEGKVLTPDLGGNARTDEAGDRIVQLLDQSIVVTFCIEERKHRLNMDKIVLLPQTKRELIQTASEAFQAADYEHAVTVLEELVHYNVSSFEIHMNLVISLMKVKEWTKAIDYAEDFIPLYTKDKQSQLVELIVMALFEQEDFPATLARIEEAFEEEIVPEVQQRLEMIRVLCSEQNAIRSKTLLHEMEMLVKQEEHIELFYIMKEWKRLNIQPPDVFNDFLKNSFVHPVIKTFILEELQDNNISETVEVEKFGKIIEVVPNQIEKYNQQKF